MNKNTTEPLMGSQSLKVEEKDKRPVFVTEDSVLNNKGLIFISNIYEEPSEIAQLQTKQKEDTPLQNLDHPPTGRKDSDVQTVTYLGTWFKKQMSMKQKMEDSERRIRRYVTMGDEMKKMKNAVSSQGLYQDYCSKFVQYYLNCWRIDRVFGQVLRNSENLEKLIPQSARQSLGIKDEMFKYVPLPDNEQESLDWHNTLAKHNLDVVFSRQWFQYLYLKGESDEKFKMILTEFNESKPCTPSIRSLDNPQETKKDQQIRTFNQNFVKNLKFEKTFVFKTLKIFDREVLIASIFVEMIEGTEIDLAKFNQNKGLFSTNVSTIEWRRNFSADQSKFDQEHNLYFFQRHYQYDQQQGSEKSSLQLMRLDLISLFQTGLLNLAPVKGYCFLEQQGRLRNVLFSSQVDESNSKSDSEEDFLSKQYVMLQSYDKDRRVEVCSLRDLELDARNKEAETSDFKNIQREDFILPAKVKLNQMVFNVFHLEETYKEKDSVMHKIVFLAATQSQILNFQFKLNKDEKEKRLDTIDEGAPNTDRKSQSLAINDSRRTSIKKVDTQANYQMQEFANPMVPINIESLDLNLTGTQKRETKYYFYIDSKNSVIPLYPLPTEKVLYHQLIELIKKKLNINDADKDLETYSTVYHQKKKSPIKAFTGMKTENLVEILKIDKEIATKLTEGMQHAFFLATQGREQILTLIVPQIGVKKPIYIWSLKQPGENNFHLTQQLDEITEQNQHSYDQLLNKQIKQLRLKLKFEDQNQEDDEHNQDVSFQRDSFIPSTLHLDGKSCRLIVCPMDNQVKSIFSLTQSNKMTDQFYTVNILDSNKDFKNINVYNTSEFLKEFDSKLEKMKIVPKPISGAHNNPSRPNLTSPRDNRNNSIQKNKIEADEQLELNTLGVQIKMEHYSVFTKNKEDHYFFVFQFSFKHMGRRISSYFVITKSLAYMNSVFMGENTLFKITDQLNFIYDQQTLVMNDFISIRQEMKDQLAVEDHDMSENEQKSRAEDTTKKLQRIKLIFPKAIDDRTKPNFIAYVCQTKVNNTKRERAFIVYDLLSEEFTVQKIQMRFKNQELTSRDKEGFENIMLCQTSNFLTSEKSSDYNAFCQVKYSMLVVFLQEVGMIKIRDFIVTQKKSQSKSTTDTYIQLIGMKHIFFSNDFIKRVNYDVLANFSFSVPLYHESQVRRNKTKQNLIEFKRKSSARVLTPDQQNAEVNLEPSDDDMQEKQLGKGETMKQIDGLKLILFIDNNSNDESNNQHIILNFPETINNVLYTCRSDLILMGNLHQQLSVDNKAEYCQIISMRISHKALTTVNKEITYGEPILNNNEALIVLEKFTKKVLSQQIPDLEYVVLNSYQNLLSKNFFQNQELLEGKSLCEIAISDYQIVTDACADILQSTQSNNNPNTLLKKICQNDSYRKKVMEQLEFNEKVYLLNLDFDFKGTINRGIECGAEQSIKVLIQTIFEMGKSEMFYHDMIMIDLLQLMKARNFDLDFFFSNSLLNDGEQSCGLTFERELLDFNLPQYSQKENQVQIIKESNIFNEVREQELNKMVIEQENLNKLLNPNKTATNRVEHCYINLAIVQLSAKINVDEEPEVQDFVSDFKEMNHLALAKLIAIKAQSKDLNFYRLRSVQRIIQMQWESAKIVLFAQFFIFCAFYLLPLLYLVLNHRNYRDLMWELQHVESSDKQHDYHVARRSVWESVKSIYEQHSSLSNSSLKLCLMTRILFFINELFQIKENKMDYFSSFWNWCDLFEFFGFIIYSMTIFGYIEITADYLPEILYCVIVLAFLKLMFFIRMSESLGFITNMIFNCLIALIPFTIVFMFFLFLFTILLIVLNNDVDQEVAEGAEYLPRFQQALLQTFRTSVGELGLPKYPEIYGQEESFRKYLNIYMIWCTWYTQCFFNLVVMLNFIIAVINSAYEEVKEQQTMISFRNKAEMNREVFELKRNIFNLDPFTLVLFSQLKKSQEQEIDPSKTKFDQVKKMFENQSRVQDVYNEKVKDSLTDIQLKQQEMLQSVKVTSSPAAPPAQSPNDQAKEQNALNKALIEMKDLKKQLQEQISKLKQKSVVYEQPVQQKELNVQNMNNQEKAHDREITKLAQRIELQEEEINELKALLKETDLQYKKEINKNQLEMVKLMDKVNQLEKSQQVQQDFVHSNEESKSNKVLHKQMTLQQPSVSHVEEDEDEAISSPQMFQPKKILVMLSTHSNNKQKEKEEQERAIEEAQFHSRSQSRKKTKVIKLTKTSADRFDLRRESPTKDQTSKNKD